MIAILHLYLFSDELDLETPPLGAQLHDILESIYGNFPLIAGPSAARQPRWSGSDPQSDPSYATRGRARPTTRSSTRRTYHQDPSQALEGYVFHIQ